MKKLALIATLAALAACEGDIGPRGPTGPNGPQGQPGTDGASGEAGPAGVSAMYFSAYVDVHDERWEGRKAIIPLPNEFNSFTGRGGLPALTCYRLYNGDTTKWQPFTTGSGFDCIYKQYVNDASPAKVIAVVPDGFSTTIIVVLVR